MNSGDPVICVLLSSSYSYAITSSCVGLNAKNCLRTRSVGPSRSSNNVGTFVRRLAGSVKSDGALQILSLCVANSLVALNTRAASSLITEITYNHKTFDAVFFLVSR